MLHRGGINEKHILVLSGVIIGGVFLLGNRKIKNVKSSEKYKVQEYTFYKAEPKNLPIGTSHIAGVYSGEYDSKYHSLYIGQLITLFGEADYTTDSNENLTSYTIGAEDKNGKVRLTYKLNYRMEKSYGRYKDALNVCRMVRKRIFIAWYFCRHTYP